MTLPMSKFATLAETATAINKPGPDFLVVVKQPLACLVAFEIKGHERALALALLPSAPLEDAVTNGPDTGSVPLSVRPLTMTSIDRSPAGTVGAPLPSPSIQCGLRLEDTHRHHRPHDADDRNPLRSTM